MTKNNIMLVAIIALGSSLRLYRLGARGLTWDETFSFWASNMSLPEMVRATASDTHPPLYFLLLHYWMGIFGTSESALHLLSAFFGILALLAIYLVGQELFDREAGLLAAFLLALSAFNIEYSQEARMYSLIAFLSLLSIYFFLRILRQERGTLAITVGYILSTTLLLYTHLYGLLIVIVQNTYLLTSLIISKRHSFQLRRWVTLQAAVAVLFVPWVPIIFSVAATKAATGFWIPRPTIQTLIETLLFYVGEMYKNSPYFALLYIFATLSVFSLITYRKTSSSSASRALQRAFDSLSWEVRLHATAPVYLLVVWIVVINAVPFIASYFVTPFYYYKYTIAASVALYLLVAKGIKNVNNMHIKLATLGVIAVLCSTSVLAYYNAPLHDEGREPSNIINQNAKRGDLILTAQPDGGESIFWHYYLRATAADVKAHVAHGNATKQVKEIQATIQGYDRVWFLIPSNDPKMASTETLVLGTLNESYKTTIFRSKAYNLYLFENNITPS